MATVKAYAKNLWAVEVTVCRKLGIELPLASQSTRVLALCNTVLFAGLFKVLTDNGVVTDAQLNNIFNAIAAADFPSQPVSVPAPTDDTLPPTPDLGV